LYGNITYFQGIDIELLNCEIKIRIQKNTRITREALLDRTSILGLYGSDSGAGLYGSDSVAGLYGSDYSAGFTCV
jgi:hypothetical protein